MNGATTTVCDGNAVWIAAPYEDEPVPLLPLSGGALDGAKLDAQLNFPAQIKRLLTGWRVGYPYSIGDTDTQVVQGLTAAGSPVKLYFDRQSGLLVRQVRYASTAAGAPPHAGGLQRLSRRRRSENTLSRDDHVGGRANPHGAHGRSTERAHGRREIRPARARSALENR